MQTEEPRLSQLLKSLAERCSGKETSLEDLISFLGVKSHSLIILIFCLPFMTPIPVPGLSFLFGSVILMSTFGIILNKPVWLPARFATKRIQSTWLEKTLLYASKGSQKIEFLIKPRGQQLFDLFVVKLLIGLVLIISALILMLPLPPGTNFPPAFVCVLLAVSLLEKDILLLITGFIVFILKIGLIYKLISYFQSLPIFN